MRVLTFGAVLQDGELEMQPGFVTEGEPSHQKGELTVEALGRGGRTLAITTLPLDTPCAYPGGETALAAVGLVAFPEKATGLRVSLDEAADGVAAGQTAALYRDHQLVAAGTIAPNRSRHSRLSEGEH